MHWHTILPIFMAVAAFGATPAIWNVRDFGAAGDGKKKDTAALQRAIDACAKAGGGTVLVPAGRYLTGAIELRSNVAVELQGGATLAGSEDPADYPVRKNPYGERDEISALVYAHGVHNVALRGSGTIDGQGEIWWKRQWFSSPKKNRPTPQTPADFAEAKKIPNGRPHLIKIVEAQHVLIEGLTLLNSASWTVNPVMCEFVTVRGLTIVNPPTSPNTDGINPESCRNVHISDCTIDVGDDCITLKSGKDENGRRVGRPDENITVTNCTMLHGHGAIVIGSEMSGGVRNVTVSNCVFRGTDKGVRIKSQRGRGGVVEGIAVSNIVMHDVPEAINITMFYSAGDNNDVAQKVNEGTPAFRDILLSNITARGSKSAGQITGLRERAIEGVTLSNVRIQAAKGFTAQFAKDIVFHNVEIDAADGSSLIGRNIDGLLLENFRTRTPRAGVPLTDLRDVRTR